jgi:hypothetical protein
MAKRVRCDHGRAGDACSPRPCASWRRADLYRDGVIHVPRQRWSTGDPAGCWCCVACTCTASRRRRRTSVSSAGGKTFHGTTDCLPGIGCCLRERECARNFAVATPTLEHGLRAQRRPLSGVASGVRRGQRPFFACPPLGFLPHGSDGAARGAVSVVPAVDVGWVRPPSRGCWHPHALASAGSKSGGAAAQWTGLT